MRKRVVAGLAGVALFTALVGAAQPVGADESSEPVAETTGCSEGQWPAAVEGQPPGLAPGAPAGMYLWHDTHGWHAVVTEPGRDPARFAGRIRSASEIYGVERRTERRDALVRQSEHVLRFRFTNFGGLDGIQFRTRCGDGIGVTGALNGTKLTPDQVFIGADGHHPATVSFVIRRG